MIQIMRQRTIERLIVDAYTDGLNDGRREAEDWARDVQASMVEDLRDRDAQIRWLEDHQR